jgi:hypothetical protein
METTLNTLKNLYAQEQGYVGWETLRFHSSAFERERQWTEICIRAQKAALEKAAEKLERKIELTSEMGMEKENWAFSQSYRIITNPENLIQ